MIRLGGGDFKMGSDAHYPEEAPTRQVTVRPFWIDITPVTIADFARFVEATAYVTTCELLRFDSSVLLDESNQLQGGVTAGGVHVQHRT